MLSMLSVYQSNLIRRIGIKLPGRAEPWASFTLQSRWRIKNISHELCNLFHEYTSLSKT